MKNILAYLSAVVLLMILFMIQSGEVKPEAILGVLIFNAFTIIAYWVYPEDKL